MKAKILTLGTLLLILIAGYMVVSLIPGAPQERGVTCSMEAKLCSDGSAVGRTGPKCEFAACPASTSSVSLKTFTDTARGITYQYPEKLGTTYIKALDWPPEVAIYTGPFLCEEAGAVDARGGKTEKRVIGSRTYCVTLESEGAAGSVYNLYSYKTTKNDKLVIFTFSTQATQCGNYAEPKKTECEKERAIFNIDVIIDQITQSFVLKTAPSIQKSGVTGTVLLGPICPVMQNPPDPQCADKPYAVNLVLTSKNGTYIMKTFSSNASGTFQVDITPGEYMIRSAASANMLPRCSSNGTVTVHTGSYTHADISCDTGIR